MENLEEQEEKKVGMSKEAALEELSKLVEDFTFSKMTDPKIEATYPQVLNALIEGTLSLGSEPKYVLREPICFKTGAIDIEEVSFRTRVTVSDKEKIARTIDMKDDPLGYSYATMAFIMNLKSKAYLDKMGRYDLKVCEQLSTLFV